MQNFIYDIPTKLLFGKGQIENLTSVLQSFGKNVLLTYGGGSIKKSGLYDDIMQRLTTSHFHVVELSGIEPNPRIETVRKGVELCHVHNIDVILAVGGGSTLDCSKAICAGYYYSGDLWEMVLHPQTITKTLPLVDILTLSATGSEFDAFGVISNPITQEKIGSPFCYPNVSICDPAYTFSVPALQTAAGSADIMSHVLEVYFSEDASCDLAEGISEIILRSVIKNLPIVLKDPHDYDARANLMWNSTWACSGITGMGKINYTWSCHAIEHKLSAFYDITHGVGLAILTPRWMEYILNEKTVDRFTRFSRNVWGLEDDDPYVLARKGIQALYDFFVSVNLPMTLHEVGIDETHFEKMAEDAVKYGELLDAYVSLTKEDVMNILKACL